MEDCMVIECPKCGSTDLYYEGTHCAHHRYYCKNCGAEIHHYYLNGEIEVVD